MCSRSLAFLQQERGAAADNIDAVIDEVLNRLDQPHFLGLVVHHRQQDHAEVFLHLRVLEKLVEHDLRFGAALQFDHDAHAVAIALVANVGDVFDGLVVDQLGHALDQVALVHLIRNFGDDDGVAVFRERFDRGAGAHGEAAASVLVGIENSRLAVDDSGGREIRAFDDLQNLRQRGRGIVHQRDRGIDDLGQIVRRNFCGHADGNSVGAVNKKIGNAGWAERPAQLRCRRSSRGNQPCLCPDLRAVRSQLE